MRLRYGLVVLSLAGLLLMGAACGGGSKDKREPGSSGEFRATVQNALKTAALTLTAQAAGQTPEPTLSLTGSYEANFSLGARLQGDEQFLDELDSMPEELDVAISGDTITIQGEPPFINVNGAIDADGVVSATGTGTFAGSANVDASFEGTLRREGRLTGTYTLGANGGLPGGQPATYSVEAELD